METENLLFTSCKTCDYESDREDSNIDTYRQHAICGVIWLSAIFVCKMDKQIQLKQMQLKTELYYSEMVRKK